MKRSAIKRTTGLKQSGPLKRTPLKRRSKKKEKQDREYSKLKRAYFARLAHEQGVDWPWCECYGPPHPAIDIHHIEKVGVGGARLDESNWLAVCREAHDWIHSHQGEARSKGWLK